MTNRSHILHHTVVHTKQGQNKLTVMTQQTEHYTIKGPYLVLAQVPVVEFVLDVWFEVEAPVVLDGVRPLPRIDKMKVHTC